MPASNACVAAVAVVVDVAVNDPVPLSVRFAPAPTNDCVSCLTSASDEMPVPLPRRPMLMTSAFAVALDVPVADAVTLEPETVVCGPTYERVVPSTFAVGKSRLTVTAVNALPRVVAIELLFEVAVIVTGPLIARLVEPEAASAFLPRYVSTTPVI